MALSSLGRSTAATTPLMRDSQVVGSRWSAWAENPLIM